MASVFKVQYTARDKNGRKIRRKSKKYYAQYRDEHDRVKRVPLCTDREASWAMLNDITRRVELLRAGRIDRYEEHHKRPLSEHLADFEKSLRNSGSVDGHWKVVVFRARSIVVGCKFRYIAEITPSAVETYLATLKSEKDLGTQTINHYINSVKQFCRWLMIDKRTNENALVGMKGGNVKLDIRHERREFFSEGEMTRLLEATRTGKMRSKLSGEQRYMLYLAAISTGFRASELHSLIPESFNLKADPPTVTVLPKHEKARRGDTIPLPASFVEILKPWLASIPPGTPLWPGKWAAHTRGGEMVRYDLGVARDAWITESGDDQELKADREGSDFLQYVTSDNLVLDFHALRHAYLSRLGRSGAPPKVMQRLARHSTITLTMKYAKANLMDLSSAVDNLPDLPGTPSTIPMRKTGA